MGYMGPFHPVIDWLAWNCANSGSESRSIDVCSELPVAVTPNGDDMTRMTSLSKFTVPLGGQEIELQQVDFDTGGLSFLRIRIREKSRFTIFDIDPDTAAAWGQMLLEWSARQPRETAAP